MGDDYKIFRLKINLPYLKKGKEFYFDYITGEVFGMEGGRAVSNSLRSGLSGYLWLLLCDRDKYLEEIDL